MSKSKKTSSTSNQTLTNTLDPTYSAAVYGNLAHAQQAAGSLLPFSGQRVAGFNDIQNQAQQGLLHLARSNIGGGLLEAAAQAATGAATYKPLMINPTSYQAAKVAPVTNAAAAVVNRGDIRNVSTGPISTESINHYLNPFTDDVVNTSLADINRQRQIEQVNNAGIATKQHAFGGTGAAVLQSLTNADYGRTAASTAANLRSQGFNTALSAAQADEARRLQAEQANQGVDLSVAGQNAGLLNTANQFNASALNTAALADQAALNDAARFNAGQDLTAQQANQAAGQAGNAQAISAAGLLGNLSDLQRQHAIGDIGLLGQVGDVQQAQAQKELDAALEAWKDGVNLTLQQQQLVNQALALLPVQQTVTQNGSSTTKETDNGGIVSTLGQLAGLALAPVTGGSSLMLANLAKTKNN